MLSRITASLVLLTLQAATICASSGPVDVALAGRIEVSEGIVTVSDVARISGGDLTTRRKIAKLDVANWGKDEATGVTKDQVAVRILLAGISQDRFKVTGAARVLFKAGQDQSPETRVLDFLRPNIARQLDLAPGDIQLRLTRPLAADADRVLRSDSKLVHFLPPTIRVGPMMVKIGIYRNERLVKTTAVSLEVQMTRRVFVAKRPLGIGTIISEEDVVEERRMLAGQLAKYVTADVLGKKVRKAIKEGGVVSELNLQQRSQRQQEIVIRSRDVVEVVARRNALQVRISGAVALQQGTIGDTIRVKNPGTGRVLTATVVDAGIVEIRL